MLPLVCGRLAIAARADKAERAGNRNGDDPREEEGTIAVECARPTGRKVAAHNLSGLGPDPWVRSAPQGGGRGAAFVRRGLKGRSVRVEIVRVG